MVDLGGILGELFQSEQALRSAVIITLGTVTIVLALATIIYQAIASRSKKHSGHEWQSWMATKWTGVFIVIFLAVLANHPVVYLAAVLIAATLVTDTGFLESLAGALTRHPNWQQRSATPKERWCKELFELLEQGDRGSLLMGTDQGADIRARHEQYLSAVRNLLVDEGVFRADQFQVDVALTSEKAPKTIVVDAVAEDDSRVIVIEVKASTTGFSLTHGLETVLDFMQSFEEFLSERGRSKKVKGLLVTPRAETPVEMASVFNLQIDPETGDPENVSELREWLREF